MQTAYFLYKLSALMHAGDLFDGRKIADAQQEGGLPMTKNELAEAHAKYDGQAVFVTERELYKMVKRRSEGADATILCPTAVSHIVRELHVDFPKAEIVVLEDV
jgi:hypothetical protein